jgi:hypothetical protein
VGNWTADVEVDYPQTLQPGEAVTLKIGSVEFVGSVFRSGDDSGRYMARIHGGSGRLVDVLPPKNYVGVTLSTVLGEIAEATEQPIASDSLNLSAVLVANWQRTAGAASGAVQDIADRMATDWRVTRAGELRLGDADFTASNIESTEILQQPTFGSAIVAPDVDNLFEPGTTYNGRPVSYVATEVKPGGIRQELFFDDSEAAAAGRIKGSLEAIIEAVVGRRLAYHALWPCTVALQAFDGRLQLIPDDEKIRGLGLGSILARHGEPGYSMEVPPGARCLVGFEAGDPSRPYVAQWLRETAVDSVTFDGGTENIARTNDTTATGLLTVSQPIPGGAILFSYTDGTGSPPVVFSIAATGLALAPGTTVLNLAGLITSGNPTLRA